MTGHQEYPPLDALPPGLCPCGIIFGSVLLQVEGWGQSFRVVHCGANTETLSLCTVHRQGALNPHVSVDLGEKERDEVGLPKCNILVLQLLQVDS